MRFTTHIRAWLTGALALFAVSATALTPAQTADQLLDARPSMAGRSINNPLAVQALFEEQLSDAQGTWGKDSLQAADARILLGHATVDSWDQRKYYRDALRVARATLPDTHPLIGRYLSEIAGGLITAGNYRNGDDFLEQASAFFASADNAEVELGRIHFYRGLQSEAKKKPVESAQWYGRAASTVEALMRTNEEALSLASMAHGNAIRVLEAADERELASTHCRAVAQLAVVEGNAMPRQVLLVPPPYPRKLLLSKTEGAVTFAFTVTTDGFVRDIEIESVEGSDEFGDALLETIESWRFSPRIKNGEIVSARLRNRYLFSRENVSDP